MDRNVFISEFGITCRTNPEVCVVREWNPETDTIDPMLDKQSFCDRYSSKCVLDRTLLDKYITTGKFVAIIDGSSTKPVLLSSTKCAGVSCGSGQYCVNGCCQYWKRISKDLLTMTGVKEVSLSSGAASKYILSNENLSTTKLIAKPVAIEQGTASLAVQTPLARTSISTTRQLTANSAAAVRLAQ